MIELGNGGKLRGEFPSPEKKRKKRKPISGRKEESCRLGTKCRYPSEPLKPRARTIYLLHPLSCCIFGRLASQVECVCRPGGNALLPVVQSFSSV